MHGYPSSLTPLPQCAHWHIKINANSQNWHSFGCKSLELMKGPTIFVLVKMKNSLILAKSCEFSLYILHLQLLKPIQYCMQNCKARAKNLSTKVLRANIAIFNAPFYTLHVNTMMSTVWWVCPTRLIKSVFTAMCVAHELTLQTWPWRCLFLYCQIHCSKRFPKLR